LIVRGGTVGIIGGGQLAWMMGLEASRIGYRIAVLDPSPRCPASSVARLCVPGAWDDVDAALELAQQVDVLTCDTEHVPAELLDAVERLVPVRPRPDVLRTVQDRLTQRRFIEACGVPQPRIFGVSSEQELEAAKASGCFPGILKSRRAGYDGRGQARVAAPEDLPAAWASIGEAPAVLEAFVPFDMEVSVVLARAADGQVRFYPMAENVHQDGILRITRAPAPLPEAVCRQAQELARVLAQELGHVGALAVELFVHDGELLVNEIAPRVHNSGHFTLGGCVTSQFEQHVRAICGEPLGSTDLLCPTVMVNLLGEAFADGRDPVARIHREWPDVRVFLYGKEGAQPGRKMAHVLVHDVDSDRAFERARELSEALHAPAAG
jgi:5-(carboxyamino)imidazole ribonucleotide synthase